VNSSQKVELGVEAYFPSHQGGDRAGETTKVVVDIEKAMD
jgi:hypothetical protein